MGKHRVILKTSAEGSPQGPADFLDKFAKAYKMSVDQARAYIQRSGGVLYNTDDLAAAQKGKAFIERLGGVVVMESDPEPEASRATLPAPDMAAPAAAAPAAAAPSYLMTRKSEDPGKSEAAPTTDDNWSAPTDGDDWGVPGFDDNGAPAPQSSAPAEEMPPDFDETGQVSPAATAGPGADRPCPKCEQPVPAGEDQCPACHIYISKYEKMLERRARQLGTAPAGDQALPGAPPGAPAPGLQPIERDPVKAAAAAGVQIKCMEASYALMYSLIGLGCGGLLGPVAIIYGLKAMNIINNDPRFTGNEKALAGIIIGIIETVLFGVLLFLAVRMAQHGFFHGLGYE